MLPKKHTTFQMRPKTSTYIRANRWGECWGWEGFREENVSKFSYLCE